MALFRFFFKNMKRLVRFWPISALFIIVNVSYMPLLNANSDENQELSDIDRRLADFTHVLVDEYLKNHSGAHYQLSVRALTKPLLPCNSTPTISLMGAVQPPTRTVRLSIECYGQWRRYRVVDVEILLPVVVSGKKIERGQIIAQSDLTLVDTPWNRLRGRYITNIDKLVGRQLKRSVSAGKLLDMSYLVPEYLVNKGDMVTIVVGNNGFQVSVLGIALENGELKEDITVRNKSSGKIIDAKIISRGKVRAWY